MGSAQTTPDQVNRPRGAGRIVAVGAALFLVAGVGIGWYYFRPERRAAVAQRLTDDGYAHWRRGDLRAAEIALSSAQEIDPHATRSALLLGRMLLSTSERERGRAIFARLLRSAPTEQRDSLAANYHDALVCVGWWEELARFSVGELARLSAPQPVWLDSALSGFRLGRVDATWAEGLPGWDRLDSLSSALLRTQIDLNESRPAAARERLASLRGAYAPITNLAIARLWLQVGDDVGASLALARVNVPLSDSEILLGELLASRREPQLAGTALGALLALPEQGNGVAESAIAILVARPAREIAEQLSAHFAPRAAKSTDSLVAALFVYCSLAGADKAATLWGDEVRRRAGTTPLRLAAGRLDQRTALFLINNYPLSRDVIVGLLDAAVESDSARVATTAAAGPNAR